MVSQGQGGEEAPTSALTTHARLERAKRELEFWRCRKAERLELMNKLQAEATRLRGLLGTLGVRSHPGCNISDQSLELIRGDIESLRSEQVLYPVYWSWASFLLSGKQCIWQT